MKTKQFVEGLASELTEAYGDIRGGFTKEDAERVYLRDLGSTLSLLEEVKRDLAGVKSAAFDRRDWEKPEYDEARKVLREMTEDFARHLSLIHYEL